ncbi:MAG TPA: hypothetical protein VLL74_01085, partial [Methanoregula sp.]|nr:hypothetical protein [Methanoregula sp.]
HGIFDLDPERAERYDLPLHKRPCRFHQFGGTTLNSGCEFGRFIPVPAARVSWRGRSLSAGLSKPAGAPVPF